MKQFWRIKVFFIKHSNSVADHDFIMQTDSDTTQREIEAATKQAYKLDAKQGNVEVKVLPVN